jgi:precorrin-8X/cobalt-precorrin-8 methylmutase
VFDRYVFVDWSGAAKPNRGKDSIWFATGTADEISAPLNPPTRAEATDMLRGLLRAATDRGERVLVGCDFPYGFPAGLAAALGLSTDRPAWRAIWKRLSECMRDAPNNANRRFHDAATLNEAMGAPPGPFWGHAPGFVDPRLTWRVRFPFRAACGQLLRELRHTERHLRDTKRLPFPVWKLAGQGAVGSQALLGIPRVASLRDDPRLEAFSRVWPFETGFSAEAVPATEPFVLHAEIWPGVLEPDPHAHPVADARQVLALVEWARHLDSEGRLAAELSPPPTLAAEQIGECVSEEGWILGASNLPPRGHASFAPSIVPPATASDSCR